MHVPNLTGSRLKLHQMKSYHVSSLHNELQPVSLVLPPVPAQNHMDLSTWTDDGT